MLAASHKLLPELKIGFLLVVLALKQPRQFLPSSVTFVPTSKKRRSHLGRPSLFRLFPLALAKTLVFSGGRSDSSVPRASPGSCCSTLSFPRTVKRRFRAKREAKLARAFFSVHIAPAPSSSTTARCSDLLYAAAAEGRDLELRHGA
jgi:hypothetical protein